MKNVLVKMINKLLGLFKPVSTIELDPNNHVYKEYYENGKLESEKSYVRNERHGISKTYHMNGQLLKEEMWVNDYSD